MTMRRAHSIVALAMIFGLSYSTAVAADADFFKDKTIRVIVAFSPGGGFDAYSRMLARHMPKHIPGNPVMIVQNMPGAGGLIATNYLYNKAKPDGLTIGNWIGGLVLQQYLGNKGVRFDAAKFEWIGAPVRIHNVCILAKQSGITDVEKWQAAKEPVKLGGSGPGSTTWDIPRIVINHTKLPTKLIEGYGGTAPIRLAVERGELAGVCASWEGLRNPWAAALKKGDVKVLVQFVDKPHPDLEDVPLAKNLMKSAEGRQILKTVVHDIGGSLNRPYSLPPGTPKDRVAILRKAYDATMKDPAFLAEAKRSKFDINPVSGEEVERLVSDVANVPAELMEKIKETFAPKK